MNRQFQLRLIGGLVIILMMAIMPGGCSSSPSVPATSKPTVAGPVTANPAAFLMLTCPVFSTGGKIPVKYTQQGDNVSPPVSWNLTPSGTQSFALIMEDIDGPSGIITHWIIFNIPGGTLELTEAVPVQDQLPNGALQGNNIRGTRGYVGPAPPAGTTHRYELTLFALDQKLGLGAGASRADIIGAIQGHIIAVGQTMGIYQR
jgi:Raf kinase inhibitor-like YbhB/YbcL family protein